MIAVLALFEYQVIWQYEKDVELSCSSLNTAHLLSQTKPLILEVHCTSSTPLLPPLLPLFTFRPCVPRFTAQTASNAVNSLSPVLGFALLNNFFALDKFVHRYRTAFVMSGVQSLPRQRFDFHLSHRFVRTSDRTIAASGTRPARSLLRTRS